MVSIKKALWLRLVLLLILTFIGGSAALLSMSAMRKNVSINMKTIDLYNMAIEARQEHYTWLDQVSTASEEMFLQVQVIQKKLEQYVLQAADPQVSSRGTIHTIADRTTAELQPKYF